MGLFNFWRVNDDAWEGCEEVCESAAKMALTSFLDVDSHYTYTAPNDELDDEDITPDDVQNTQNESEEDRDTGSEDAGGTAGLDEDMGPHFSEIL